MKLTCKSFGELSEVVGKNESCEFEGGVVVFKTSKGSFLLEKDGKAVLGVTPNNEVVIMPEENSTSVRYRINQFLPESVKLTSKNSVLHLNGEPLKRYNMVSSDGTVLMEDE